MNYGTVVLGDGLSLHHVAFNHTLYLRLVASALPVQDRVNWQWGTCEVEPGLIFKASFPDGSTPMFRGRIDLELRFLMEQVWRKIKVPVFAPDKWIGVPTAGLSWEELRANVSFVLETTDFEFSISDFPGNTFSPFQLTGGEQLDQVFPVRGWALEGTEQELVISSYKTVDGSYEVYGSIEYEFLPSDFASGVFDTCEFVESGGGTGIKICKYYSRTDKTCTRQMGQWQCGGWYEGCAVKESVSKCPILTMKENCKNADGEFVIDDTTAPYMLKKSEAGIIPPGLFVGISSPHDVYHMLPIHLASILSCHKFQPDWQTDRATPCFANMNTGDLVRIFYASPIWRYVKADGMLDLLGLERQSVKIKLKETDIPLFNKITVEDNRLWSFFNTQPDSGPYCIMPSWWKEGFYDIWLYMKNTLKSHVNVYVYTTRAVDVVSDETTWETVYEAGSIPYAETWGWRKVVSNVPLRAYHRIQFSVSPVQVSFSDPSLQSAEFAFMSMVLKTAGT